MARTIPMALGVSMYQLLIPTPYMVHKEQLTTMAMYRTGETSSDFLILTMVCIWARGLMNTNMANKLASNPTVSMVKKDIPSFNL
jgi:hypothetical protein